jgi:MFS family permease
MRKLGNSAQGFFIIYASLTAFIVYTCMYGVRKPYTVSTYEGLEQFGISYKVILVSAQVFGYMLSKFIGIRFIAEVKPSSRPKYIIGLILLGWLSLFFFAVVPFDYKFIFLFINGLPLGMIWGLVFGYLEGRRVTDILGAVLATSFIISSGIAKTVGQYFLVKLSIDQWWMPFLVASVFLIPLFIFTFFLSKIPVPDQEDRIQRTPRAPMPAKARVSFLKEYALLLVAPVISYMLLTALRDFCEDFAVELWNETGNTGQYYLFAQTSSISGFIVLFIVAGLVLLKNHFKAFGIIHLLIVLGFLALIISTILFQNGWVDAVTWMVIATTGLYLGYVACNSFFYERFVAAFQIKGNVGFLMYISDAFGYLGTVFVLLLKEYFIFQASWIQFFSSAFLSVGFLGILFIFLSLYLFSVKYKKVYYAK